MAELTIGELAKATGVATSALRYWEELGVIPAPARVSGQRRYPRSAVALVGLVLILQDVGFTLSETKELVAVRAGSPAAWREFQERKLAELDERMAKIQAARSALEHGLACKHQPTYDCPNFTKIAAARLAGASLADAHSIVH
ncbi:MerR family transcriptional regulator [Labedaea rhizosphaerae]|uniref:MerR family redox-sensitive transcriptional activator SoxR n=1 Tax=Labedaea rhizosphaerae TaxID=598644 RepID=A0A4R6SH85_LABRH|nr:MerR family transcriptional regulator [Labedaea rhizosphaerae]TDQ01154.1 MerR family redox-sensitive transcriptional activator SoxR [Labedaea rhizosphaerae]